jgi:hypothetical protein
MDAVILCKARSITETVLESSLGTYAVRLLGAKQTSVGPFPAETVATTEFVGRSNTVTLLELLLTMYVLAAANAAERGRDRQKRGTEMLSAKHKTLSFFLRNANDSSLCLETV